MRVHWFWAALLSLLLVACGGGGSDSSTPAPNDNPPSSGNVNGGSGGSDSGGGGSSGSGGEGSSSGSDDEDGPSDQGGGTSGGSEGGSSDQDGNTGGESTPPGSGENAGEAPFTYDETARFDQPIDLGVDADGNLYVMDTGNEAIRKIATTGEVSTLPALDRSGQLAVDPSGNVFLLSENLVPDGEGRAGREIHKSTPDGNTTLVRRYQYEPGFATPYRIATDSQGNLYVLSQYRTRFFVSRIDSAGTHNSAYEYSNPTGYVSDLASNPAGDLVLGARHQVESGPDNTVVYADRLIVVPHSLQLAEGQQGDVTTRPLERSAGGNMVFEENGDIYIADTTGTESSVTAIRISKVTPDGTTTTLYSGFPDGSSAARSTTESYKGEVGMARAANGDFYLSDPYLHAIYRITASGEVSLVAGKAGEAGHAD